MRGRLLALVAAATVPIAVIAGSNAWNAYDAALEQSRQEVLVLREAAVARHGSAVGSMREVLTALAADPDLLTRGPEACDATLEHARSLSPSRYSNFWVLGGAGELLCSGVPTPRGGNYAALDYFDAARSAGGFALGEFTIGIVSGRAVLPAAVPILAPDGTMTALVGGGLFLDSFLQTERRAPTIAEHHVWLLDEDGTTLPLGNAIAGALPPAPDLDRLRRYTADALQGVARDGSALIWAAEQLERGLVLLVGLPVGAIQDAARQALQQRLIELTVFVLACLAAILIGVELGVSRPLRRLAARVRTWAPGRPYEAQSGGSVPVEVFELDRALTAAAAALQDREQALTAALQQRDLLMAEIHHRVKNNLQIVASLLSLQSDRMRSETARREFAVARDRVQALAMLHRHLYMNQTFQRMSLRPFLEELSRKLGEAIGGGSGGSVAIRVEADDIELGADESISLALLLTEAVSNSVRHAFPDGRPGTVTISLRVEGTTALLRVSDDGVGIDGAADAGDGLGTQLINGFAAHLGGVAEFTSGPGTTVSVRFPLPEAARPVAVPDHAASV
ncbi:sensor histidine kinase [Roseomonas fluvialis]|uniref:histidine kinase n=1 Tax=Roseomonas fluvialis TaxID=1750527 RepID=A0ABM7Y9N2_9PROT|nr:sensor histidine kinase [Roseomonas fluvialis]BDG74806.1 histidine kinase [Roseomonas fluvialis]